MRSRHAEIYNLDGTRCLITGGGSGIGAAISQEMATMGSQVVICGRRRDPLNEIRKAIELSGGSCEVLVTDLSSERDLEELISSLSGIDILVNNAAISPILPWGGVDAAEFMRVLHINLVVPFLLAQALAPGMVSRGFGRIINISSIYGLVGGNPNVYQGQAWDIPAYVASKFGLVGLTKHLAVRLAPTGVTVNAVGPGPTVTEMSSEKLSIETIARMETVVPMGRLGSVEDVPGLVSFLSSHRAEFITGQMIAVDGGWTAW